MEEPPPPTVELPLAFVTILETYKVFNEIHFEDVTRQQKSQQGKKFRSKFREIYLSFWWSKFLNIPRFLSETLVSIWCIYCQ